MKPLTKEVLYNDKETIEIPAGCLLGEGPASIFFDHLFFLVWHGIVKVLVEVGIQSCILLYFYFE